MQKIEKRGKVVLAKKAAAIKPKKPKKVPAKKIKPKKKKKINSRAKGAAGEREFANFLKERGIEASRGQQFAGGADSPDVKCSGVFTKIHLEVKRVEAGNPYNWHDQACRDADLCKVPVVAHRKSGKRWLVILDARDFINILKGEHHD